MSQVFNERLTTLKVYYHLPEYKNILQDFTWQFLDYQPDFPRACEFIQYWEKNIEAHIHAVYLFHANFWTRKDFKNGKFII